MRLFMTAALALLVAAFTPALSTRHAPSQDASTVFAAVRAALGGEALEAIRSFTVTGSSVIRVLKSTIKAKTVEISVELPDKFLRTTRRADEGPDGAYVVTDYAGFNGNTLIDSASSPPPYPSASASTSDLLPSAPLPRPADIEFPAERRLQRQKQAFLRLMLPLFAAAPAGMSLQSESGGQALVDGRLANVVVLKMSDGTSFRLHVDAATHLPLKLAWTAGRVGREEMESGSPAMANPASPARAIEWTVTFSDYKTEAGVTWPRRLITWVGDRQFEDVRLGQYTINVLIRPQTFAPRK